MSAAVRALLIAVWVFGIGLATVYLSVDEVRSGVRVRKLLREKERCLEDVRELETRYNHMLSPDLLYAELPECFLDEDAGAFARASSKAPSKASGLAKEDEEEAEPNVPFQFSP